MNRYQFQPVPAKRRSIIRRLFQRYFSDHVGRSAAALAYYLIFSIFPFLILVSTIISFLELPPLTAESFKGLIPLDIIQIANSYLSHISEIKNASLLIFGFVFTIYFTMRAVNSLLQAVHQAYRVKSKYSFLRHQLHVFLITLFLIVVVFVAIGLITFGRTLLTWLSTWIPIDMNSINLWNFLRFFVLAVVLFTVLLLLYYLVPNRMYTFKQVMPGTLAALLSWLIFSMGFAFYVENMGRYSVVYGSIGAVIVLLLWLYFSGVTLIMGAELNCLLVARSRASSAKRSQ